MRHTTGSAIIGALAALVVIAAPLEAQRGSGSRRDGAQHREQLEQRVRAQMGRMMQERLGLTEEQAQELSVVAQQYEQRRRALFREEQATRRRVQALLAEPEADEAEAASVLALMAELRQQEADLSAEEQAALLEVLTPTQLLQLQALREQIGERIRALRRGRGDEGNGSRRGRGDTIRTRRWR